VTHDSGPQVHSDVGASIFSFSWSMPGTSAYDAWAAAFDAWLWANPQHTVAVAAGNSGEAGLT
jgi:hypothetical protein